MLLERLAAGLLAWVHAIYCSLCCMEQVQAALWAPHNQTPELPNGYSQHDQLQESH